MQAKMAELKSGATGGSNPPTDKSGCATLPEGSNVCGNPGKRQDRLTTKTLSLMRKKVVPPLVFPKKAMLLLRQPSSPGWTTIPGERKKQS